LHQDEVLLPSLGAQYNWLASNPRQATYPQNGKPNPDRPVKSSSNKSQDVPKNTAGTPAPTDVEDNIENQPAVKDTPSKSGFIDLERKQATLEESEARYRRLFETAKDGILILDGDTGRITDVNPFLQDMLGYTKTELVGKALWEIGPVKDIAASQEAMRHLQNSDYIRYEDLPLETRVGERKQVEFVSNVYLVNGWRVIQCNIRDITARKHAEILAQSSKDELVALVDELQWRDREMHLLNHMNELLLSCMTLSEAYQVIALIAGDLFSGHNGGLAILQGTNQHLDVVARWGDEAMLESTFSLEDCWGLRRGQLHEVGDPQAGLLCRHFLHSPQAGYLCLPLTVQGETLGVLSLMDNTLQKGRHQLGLQQLAETVGETIKLSLSNLKLRDELRQQAIHDPLTELYNRRYLEETLARDLYQVQRRKAPLCVVMLDLDAFKQFNDSFGHGAGDTVLRAFGRVLRDHLRKSDISCRYGGDEFVLVLPDSSVADTQERLEQIRLFLKEFPVHYGERMLRMATLSAGIAQTPEHGTTASELLQAADEALYAAKQAGGDRIVVYETAQPL
jgi:diguanylate cyclase (GGDEF)-like protein/PAS domain S-box-containing protein